MTNDVSHVQPSSSTDISVVIPVKNGGELFRECLESLLRQTFQGSWEVCIYNDCSADKTPEIVAEYVPQFLARHVKVVVKSGKESGGVGFAKNKAVEMSSGRFVCFCDADDYNVETRLQDQFNAALELLQTSRSQCLFIGSCFTRDPTNSTERYTKWANSLTTEQLYTQIYTSHGPTVIAPTWFLSRELFDRVGKFTEVRSGYPEDLNFLYRAIDAGCVLFKVPSPLVIYRYHPQCASFGVSEAVIWKMRLDRLRRLILPKWSSFTIWNAGKQGKLFFKSLEDEEKLKVTAFCDVDEKKIKHGTYEHYDEKQRRVLCKIPIVHVRQAVSPLIVCVKLDMSAGCLEELLARSGWQEDVDYVLFS